MKSKIGIVIPTLHGAGCEKLLSEMLFEFEREFDIDLILYEHKIDYNIPNNLNIITLNSQNTASNNIIYKIIRAVKRIDKIGKTIKQNNYDAVISFIDGCNINTFLGCKLHRCKTPLILAEHTINEGFFKNNKYAKKVERLYKFLLKVTYNNADKVIVISKAMKRYMKDKLKISNEMTVIYNGIDTKKFNLAKNKNSNLEKEFVNAKIKLLNVARLDDNKNQQYLINLMPEILKQKPEMKLFIIGKGEKENELKTLIKNLNLENKIFLLGWKNNVQDYMKEADVFVMSSKYEGFPMTIIESISVGLPVVSSLSNKSIYEVLKDKNYGQVVKLEDKKEFLNAIVYYLENKIDKEILHKYIKENFSLEKTTNEYIKTIKKAIDEKR